MKNAAPLASTHADLWERSVDIKSAAAAFSAVAPPSSVPSPFYPADECEADEFEGFMTSAAEEEVEEAIPSKRLMKKTSISSGVASRFKSHPPTPFMAVTASSPAPPPMMMGAPPPAMVMRSMMVPATELCDETSAPSAPPMMKKEGSYELEEDLISVDQVKRMMKKSRAAKTSKTK